MAGTAIRFGAFVALCLAFTLYLAATIGNTTLLGLFGRGPATYDLVASFDDVTGLLVNDNVKIAGVPVGKVTGIEVVEGQAVVTMQVRTEHRLPSDSAAGIRWRNLIGQRYVYLFPGGAATVLEDGDAITETTSVIDLGELFNRLGPIVAAIDESKVNEFLDTVTVALEGNEQAVSKALDDLAVLVSGLAERDEAIGRLIDNLAVVAQTVADREQQLETVLTNLTELSRTFSDNTALLETAMVELGDFGDHLSGLLAGNRAEIDRLLTNLDVALGLIEANLGPVETTLDNLDEASAAIFNSSRNGEFLNQAVLCAASGPPPCPAPVVPGLPAGDPPAGEAATPPPAPAGGPTAVLDGAEALHRLFGVTP